MAAFDTTHAPVTPGFTGRIGLLIASLTGTVKAWNDARMTRNALSQLSDRELNDIGMCRGDIALISARH